MVVHEWFNVVEDSYPHGPKVDSWQMSRQPYHNMRVCMSAEGEILSIEKIEPYEVKDCEC
jgi:hypothetical protein